MQQKNIFELDEMQYLIRRVHKNCNCQKNMDKKKGKVFCSGAPQRRIYTTAVCEVNYQQLVVML